MKMIEQAIRQAIRQVDALADARGAMKCELVVETIEALRRALTELENEHNQQDALVAGLRKRISELSGDGEAETETVGDKTYKIGEVGG